MSFGLRSEMIRWWCGLEPTGPTDAQLTYMISDVDTILGFILRPEVVTQADTDLGLKAVIRIAGEEIAAGQLFARLMRIPERTWRWRIGELEFEPARRNAVDPGGLIERGLMRLKPYVRDDPQVGPIAGLFGIPGKQGDGGFDDL